MERIIQRVNFYNPPKIELKRVAAYARVSSAKDSMLHTQLRIAREFYNSTLHAVAFRCKIGYRIL